MYGADTAFLQFLQPHLFARLTRLRRPASPDQSTPEAHPTIARNMTAERSNRRVYSAEHLRRLRSTASQPTLQLHEAIEEHDADDAELVKGTICHLCTDSTPDIISKQSSLLAVHNNSNNNNALA